MNEPQSYDDTLDVYVPGAWRCPKCSFALQKATMFVQSGTIGSTREDVMNLTGEVCPNDGEPMLRETWHQRSEDNYKWGVGLMEEIIALAGAESLPAAIEKIKALRACADALAPPEPLEQRLRRFNDETACLSGGNSHPDRCVCQEKETGQFAGTPHKHYDEPPYSCARGCGCKAYKPALPAPPRADALDAPPTEKEREL